MRILKTMLHIVLFVLGVGIGFVGLAALINVFK